MEEPLNSLLIHAPSKGLVLDAGCGQLTYTILLKYFKPKLEIIPIDIVIPERLKNRKKHSFIAASIENMPFREEIFDFIFCLSTLQLIKDDKNTLKEFHRILKRNGVLLFTVPTGKSIFRLLREIEIRCGVYRFPEFNVPHYHYYTTNSIKSLIKDLFYLVDLYGYYYNFFFRLYVLILSLIRKTLKRSSTKTRSTHNVRVSGLTVKKRRFGSFYKIKTIFCDLSYHYVVIVKKT
jgi:ubiquinone/menaquinone biosynthesis C-methylase UbiE